MRRPGRSGTEPTRPQANELIQDSRHHPPLHPRLARVDGTHGLREERAKGRTVQVAPRAPPQAFEDQRDGCAAAREQDHSGAGLPSRMRRKTASTSSRGRLRSRSSTRGRSRATTAQAAWPASTSATTEIPPAGSRSLRQRTRSRGSPATTTVIGVIAQELPGAVAAVYWTLVCPTFF